MSGIWAARGHWDAKNSVNSSREERESSRTGTWEPHDVKQEESGETKGQDRETDPIM